MNAAELLQTAKNHGIKGIVIKSFKNGQELRKYTMPNGDVYKIKAFQVEHA